MGNVPLKVAVVGHTNTGKTSLMRTLLRDVEFGEVSDRPAVTRRVEAATLLVDGRPALELFDTPGLEDSIHLLDYLESKRGERRRDNIELVREFLDSDVANARFAQEAKALKQLLASDAGLYVVDVRDAVLGKHRDELTILSWCARPIIPVLNFTASPGARTAEWREHMARVGLHATAEFDTVVFDEVHERRLFETIATLASEHRESIDRLIHDRIEQRRRLERASAALIADMLLDIAAHVLVVPSSDADRRREAESSLKSAVRTREQRCVEALLELHGFRPEDCGAIDLPIENGQWGIDLFSPETLKRFGIKAGSAAAAGAVAGLAVDAVTGGLSLGAATATGAAIGALYGAARTHARKLVDKARGMTELRCPDLAVRLLMVREIELTRAIMRRGHAAQGPVYINAPDRESKTGRSDSALPRELRAARACPRWSSLSRSGDASDLSRIEAAERLASQIIERIRAA